NTVKAMTETPATSSLDDDVRRVAPAVTSGRALVAAPVSRATWRAAGEAVVGFVVMFVALAVVIVLLVGVGLVPVLGVGFVLVALALLAARGLAWFERGRLAVQLGAPVAAPRYGSTEGTAWWSPRAW